MSKPKYGWWSYVKEMIRRYPVQTNENETKAVACAIELTERLPDGKDRMRVIQMVFLKKTHTLQGAALNVPCSYETAKIWTQQFIRLVAKSFSCATLLND